MNERIGRKIGYARVSTVDQDTTIQEQQLWDFGCVDVFSEQLSGTTIDRPQLTLCLRVLGPGDTLIVTRIDRLARSLRDLQNIVHDLGEKGIILQATEQSIDTSTAAGNAFLSMLGVFAQFETNLRKERQAEGIKKAKQEGKYKGRVPISVDVVDIQSRLNAGISKAKVARDMGISRSTLYRVLTSA